MARPYIAWRVSTAGAAHLKKPFAIFFFLYYDHITAWALMTYV
jgi:hypothetical protein